MYNRWPLGKRKTVQLMVILTILAWATQTLFHQWGFGAELPLDQAATTQPSDVAPSDEPQEKFVPAVAQSIGSTLELRSEATITGGEVKLKQVCRWADRDKATFAPIADLVLVHIGEGKPFRSISLDEIKSTLHDAGVNLATINFVGTTSCTIARGDVQYDERTALQQWIDARQGKASTTQPSQTMVVANSSPKAAVPTQAAAIIPVSNTTPAPAHLEPLPTPEPATQKTTRTLRDALIADASARLSLPVDALQIDFKAQDEKVLNLAEPTFKFQIDADRVRDLGDVQWKVTLLSDLSSSKPMYIAAFARAWQNQIVIAKPLAYKSIIQESDVIERRTLADHLSDDPLVTKSQTVGQQAARDLKPGMIMTARMVDPVPLVKSGQYVTVTLNQGSVQIKTVAKALDGGSYGQTIRVKNESTRDVFDVTLTGPQTATMNTPSTTNDQEPAAKVATARD